MRVGLLEAGRNCWRTPAASRVAFLIDAAAYFVAFRRAALEAQRSIYICGWDINSRERLVRDQPDDGLPAELLPFLDALLERRRHLQVHILAWDFAMIYAFERELLPTYKFKSAHRRIHFFLDGHHPLGASHHAKVTVIDDAVAFAGGIDLTKHRWDTPEHRADDPRRTLPVGWRYEPIHEVQAAVDGEAARVLGGWARERWRRATGRRLPPPPPAQHDPWPAELAPDLRDVAVGIARTEAAHQDQPQVSEVKALTLDAIRAAGRWLYIENQYLTSAAVAEALCARLQEPHGPEVVIAVPQRQSGWLEQSYMGMLRGRVVEALLAADRHGRLRIGCPAVPGPRGNTSVNLHSKVMIVDDQLVRIGSANLSNRSLGLDTECDLVVEATRPDIGAGIARLRARLLGEHLGVDPGQIEERLAATGSLCRVVDELNRGARALAPLEPPSAPLDLASIDNGLVADNERPVDADQLLDELMPEEVRKPAHRTLVAMAAALLALFAIAAAWRYSGVGLDVPRVAAWVEAVTHHPLAPLWVIGIYVVGGLVIFPVTVLTAATALAFEPGPAIFYAVVGALASASVTYAIGRKLSPGVVRRLAGTRLLQLRERLRRRGVLTVATLRLVPVAPYSVVNAVAGAIHIRFRDFLLGSLIGRLPGVVGIAFFTDQLRDVIRDPDPKKVSLLGLVVVSIALGALWLRQRLDRPARPPVLEPQQEGGA